MTKAQQTWYQKNRERILAEAKRKRDEDPVHRAAIYARSREIVRGYRREMLAAYGDKCACCGEDTPEFMCLDHVGGGGTKHRQSVSSIALDLRRRGWPQEGFRLLCANCNQATIGGKTCPHQSKINDEEPEDLRS